jgi:tetratricopeptide (TPR) repeat protein
MLRVIREEEPSKPSTKLSTAEGLPVLAANRGTEPAKLTRLLRGELDWIVMKALEKDRNRRYETANGVALDVQRYLADEPVRACPPSTWYRCRNFMRRHRAGVGAAAAILFAVVVVVAAVAGSIGWAERDRAAHQAAVLAAVNRELDQAEALLQSGKWPSAAPAVDRAAEFLAAGEQSLSRERLERLQEDLAMAKRLEEIYSHPRQHEFFRGKEQNVAYARAFREYGIDIETLPAGEAADRIRARSIRMDLARGLDFWSSMRRRAGNESAPDWKQLLEVAMAADSDPWRNQLRDALRKDDRKALLDLAATANVAELPPETLTLLGRTLAEFLGAPVQAIALQRQYPGDLWINDALGWFYLNVKQPRQFDEAARFYTAALAVRPRTPFLIVGIGLALQANGALEESAAEFSRAIQVDPGFGPAWHARGWTYGRMKQWDKALVDLSQATALDPADYLAWRNRAHAHARLGQWQQAMADWDTAMELHPAPPEQWRNERVLACGTLGAWDKAAADLRSLSPDYPPVAHDRWVQLACVHLMQGDVAGYRQLCRQLLGRAGRSQQGFLGQSGYIVSRTCLLAPREKDEPEPDLRWAQPMIAGQPASAWYHHTLALAHYRAGRFEQARACSDASIRAEPLWTGTAQNWLVHALIYARQGQTGQATWWWNKAVEWRGMAIGGPRLDRLVHPLDMHPSDWLAFQVLYREAEPILGKREATVTQQK